MSRKERKGYIIRWFCVFIVATLVFGPATAMLGASIHCLIVYFIRRMKWQDNTVLKVLFGA